MKDKLAQWLINLALRFSSSALINSLIAKEIDTRLSSTKTQLEAAVKLAKDEAASAVAAAAEGEKTLKDQIATLQIALSGAQAELKKQWIDQTQQHKTNLETMSREYSSQAARLTAEKADLANQFAAYKEQAQGELATIRQQAQNDQDTLNTVRQEIARISSLSTSSGDLVPRSELDNTRAQLQSDTTRYTSQITDLKSQVASLTSALGTARHELTSQTAQLKTALDTINKARNLLSKFNIQL